MKITCSALLLFISISLTSQNLERLQANYEQRNFKRVIEEGLKLVEQYPDNTLLNHLLGRALTDEKAFKAAIPYLEKSKTALDAFPWMRAWSANYLGSCYYALDDLAQAGMKPIKRNRLINEGVAVAFDQTHRDRLALAKAVFKKGFTIKKLMQKAKRYPEEVLYPIGGALITFLQTQGEEERLKDLLYQQTWENLILLYSEEKIKAFEAKMK